MDCPIPLDEFAASVGDPATAVTLPPRAYVAEDFHRFELAAVWRREWLCVGRAEEIPAPGDHFTAVVAEAPVLVVRQRDGTIAAMSAVCRHRAMVLTEGCGRGARAFVCPYHRWVYDLRGALLAAPQAGDLPGFDRAGYALPGVAVAVWHGFVFVNLDGAAEPLAPRLAPLEHLAAAYDLANLRGEFLRDPQYRMEHDHPWNWKIYAEGQAECYHCDKLHGDTPVMRAIDFATLRLDVCDAGAGVFAFSMRTRGADVTVNHLGRAVFPAIGPLTPAQRERTHSVVVAPNLFLQLMADSVIALAWLPTGPAAMRVKRHRLYPQSTLDRPDFPVLHEPERAAVRHFVAQDERAFARVQAGLRSPHAGRGPLTPREPVLLGLNRWLVDRYRRACGG